jgi:hypothetical protein
MGLLEYQAMPSMRDVDHDGILCTFTIHITAAGNSNSSQLGSSCQGPVQQAGGTARPSCTKSHLAFGLIGYDEKAVYLFKSENVQYISSTNNLFEIRLFCIVL